MLYTLFTIKLRNLFKFPKVEFVFNLQDAVSRKISLDTLVDFAEAHGSQWIFITPHDTRYLFQPWT